MNAARIIRNESLNYREGRSRTKKLRLRGVRTRDVLRVLQLLCFRHNTRRKTQKVINLQGIMHVRYFSGMTIMYMVRMFNPLSYPKEQVRVGK